jgi:hypothetical protein
MCGERDFSADGNQSPHGFERRRILLFPVVASFPETDRRMRKRFSPLKFDASFKKKQKHVRHWSMVFTR